MTLIQMSLMGGIMILVTALLRALAGKYLPRRAFLWLWTAAVCRLLLPFEVSSPLSIYRLLKKPAELAAAAPSPAVTQPVQPVSPAAIAPTVISVQEGAHIWQTIWLAGVILLVSCLLLSALHWRRRFRRAIPVCTEVTNAWRQDAPLRRPLAIRELEGLHTPLTYGVFRPVILLPAGMTCCSEMRLRCILTHEYVHICRLDAVRKLVLTLTLCLHWFNPAVWLLLRLADRDMELFCDEQALFLLGEPRRKIYAETLLHTAAQRCDEIPLCNFFGKTTIEERILMITKKKATTLFSIFLAVVLLVGVTTALATTGPEADDEHPDQTAYTVGTADADDETQQAAQATTVQSLDSAERSAVPALIWPAENCPTVTSVFGKSNPVTGAATDHITISGDSAKGSDVCAAAAGTVTAAAWNSKVGNYIEIDHGNGLETRYTHCAELLVSRGDAVTQGQVIASVGQTGMATGPCLGFYVAQDGTTVDPMTFFPEN